MPVTHLLWNFDTGTFDFSRAYYRRLSRARSKISRSFFPKLSRASWENSRAFKYSCHGHFNVCHGHFCALISYFRSHKKGDILESRFNGLQFMRLFVFEKNKLVFGYRVEPKNDQPVKQKPMLKSSQTRSTPKQRQTHVQKLKFVKKPYVR